MNVRQFWWTNSCRKAFGEVTGLLAKLSVRVYKCRILFATHVIPISFPVLFRYVAAERMTQILIIGTKDRGVNGDYGFVAEHQCRDQDQLS